MTKGQQEIPRKAIEVLYQLGFTLIQNDGFIADFERKGSDWEVTIGRERYINPRTTIYIYKKNKDGQKKCFVLGFLMKIFSDKRSDTLINQLSFLLGNSEKIFDPSLSYEKEYDDANTLICNAEDFANAFKKFNKK